MQSNPEPESDALIFEKSRKNTFKKCPHLPDALARASLAIPELSEPEVIRPYTALSKLNFGMATGILTARRILRNWYKLRTHVTPIASAL